MEEEKLIDPRKEDFKKTLIKKSVEILGIVAGALKLPYLYEGPTYVFQAFIIILALSVAIFFGGAIWWWYELWSG